MEPNLDIDDRTKLEVEILLKDHERRFAETNIHMQRYHNQVNLIYAYASLLLTLAMLNTSDKISQWLRSSLLNSNHIFFGCLLILALIVLSYITSTMIDSLYMMYANGARMEVIEKQVNLLMGKELMAWESQIIRRLHSLQHWHYKSLVIPGYLTGLWSILLSSAIIIFQIVLWQTLVKVNTPVFAILALTMLLFHIHQWVVLHTDGIGYLRALAYKESLNENKMNRFRINYALLLSFATFTIGFLPMVILSIHQGAFWFQSQYSFPMVTIPSVLIGDSILLPIINYYFVRFIGFYDFPFLKRSRYARLSIIGSVVISLLVNLYINKLWTSDNYFGFMDIQQGSLTWAGWWHFGFSTFETSVIMIYLLLLFKTPVLRKEVLATCFTAIKRMNFALVLFSSLSILDFLIKYYYVYEKISLANALKAEIYTFAPMICFIAISVIIDKRISRALA